MYTVIAFVVWTIAVVIGTLTAEYFIVKNNTAYLLRKYTEALIRGRKLSSNIANIENAINQAIANLK